MVIRVVFDKKEKITPAEEASKSHVEGQPLLTAEDWEYLHACHWLEEGEKIGLLTKEEKNRRVELALEQRNLAKLKDKV